MNVRPIRVALGLSFDFFFKRVFAIFMANLMPLIVYFFSLFGPPTNNLPMLVKKG